MRVWWRTQTVGTYLCHPKQKKTQLFRKNINTYTELDVIFKNPRVHTDKGHQRKTETHSRKKGETARTSME